MAQCKLCNSDKLESIIPLGKLALANQLVKPTDLGKVEPRFNLEVLLCPDCGLAQLRDLVPPDQMFSDYVYFSSNSTTMLSSVAALAERLIPGLPKDAHVIEVGSNDGYLLKNYVAKGIRVTGIDPAENIAKVANDRGINTIPAFFGADIAKELAGKGQQADVIHANNVFAHVPDIHGFVTGIATLLKSTGTAVIEAPYWRDLVEKLEFDTIYHEHVYYFAVKPLYKLFQQHGLNIMDIEKLPIHGGTLRMFIQHKGAAQEKPIVQKMIAEEDKLGLSNPETFKNWMANIDQLGQDLSKTLKDLKANGKRIAAYGASAKGTTLLNYFGIGKDLLDFIADKSPAKQGLYAPGTNLPIVPPAKLTEDDVDYALLLAWNFADEIMQEQQNFRDKGGAFILPLPKVKVVNG